jgi:hypothetical protein
MVRDMVRDVLGMAWEWVKEHIGEIVGTIVDAFLGFVGTIVDKVDEALETLWRRLAKPVLDTVFPILGRILSFPGDVLEFIFGKAFDLFKFLFGFVSVPFHEIELTIYEIVVGVVRGVYDFVKLMFVNVYNTVRSFYVGVRDVTYTFIHSTVRRVRERLHTIITVDLWILGCWKAFQGSLESFSFGDFLKTAVLCMMAPVASGYIAGIITSLTPTPGTEFPGFIPSLEFPELRSEDMPGFSVVTPPPVSFPTVGVSTLPFVLVMDLNVVYEVVGVHDLGLSDSVGLSLVDGWSYGFVGMLNLTDSVILSLVDSWTYGLAGLLSLSDSVGLGLVDGWSYGFVGMFGLGDVVDLSLIDDWSYGVVFGLGLDDFVDVVLSDSWGYVVSRDLVLGDSVSIVLSDVWGYVMAMVLSLSDTVGLSLSDGWSYNVIGMSLSLSDSFGLSMVDSIVDIVGYDEVLLGSFGGAEVM